MTARLLLALAALTACGEDTWTCPAVDFYDQFSFVITDDAWQAQQYRLVVSYEENGAVTALVCDVSVPLYDWSGAIDGGLLITAQADGGVASPSSGCQPVQSASLNASFGTVSLGRALVATFEGRPARAKLEISTPSGRVLEREVELEYETQYPYGEGCGGTERAAVRIALP